MMRRLGAAPLVLLWALPLLAGLAFALAGATAPQAWRDLLNHPQLWPGLGLSLWTGGASTLLALTLALIVTAGLHQSALWQKLQPALAASLALPHLSFAIGFAFLIMPSGLLARLMVGGARPPHWITTQDPWGIALTVTLALKELPFLLAVIWSALARSDVRRAIGGQLAVARSLGHGAGSAFLRIALPQLLPSLAWPLVIVFVYGATVVDMALVIGPTQPPSLAAAIWRDLNDAEPAMNARGVAGASLLALAIALTALAVFAAFRTLRIGGAASSGPSLLQAPRRGANAIILGAGSILLATLATLSALSLAPRWPYPDLIPPQWSLASWATLAGSPAPLWLSLTLALLASVTSVACLIPWFETQGPSRDRWLLGLAILSLGLPQLIIAAGQYRLFLKLGQSGTVTGLFLAHLTPALAYAAIVLAGPYRAFDARYDAVARSLGSSGLRAWFRVKMPLLKAPLLFAMAVAFAVSMAQYVPAQLVAGGRFETLPMAAVALSAGGNRALTAVFALAMALPVFLAFALAGRLGRPRWN